MMTTSGVRGRAIPLLLATALIAIPAVVWRVPSVVETGDAEGEKMPGQPAEWMFQQRVGPDAAISPQDTARAVARSAELARRTERELPGLAASTWKTAGPTNIGGRVVDVAVDPTQRDTVYVAAASGGLWRSTDAGLTLHPVWPSGSTQSMGAVATASNGTIYVGTGEANPGGGSITYGGKGIYRSTNRGGSWRHLGLSGTSRIGRIAVDPTDPDRLFVAASGNLFTPGGQRGLYRSEDGGESWDLVLEGANATTGAIDVAIDPKNPERIYAALWDHRRHADLRRYGGPGSGIWRSTDGGGSWRKLTKGLPDGSLGRIGIAIAPSNPERLYAVVIQPSGTFRGFYTSADGGDSWSSPDVFPGLLASAQATYGWWFGRVWVDPLNELHVFGAGIQLVESQDGGATWHYSVGSSAGTMVAVHADQHGMAWDPFVPGRVYLGNDGGLYRAQSNAIGGVDWIVSLHQPFTQFYSVDVGQQDPGMIVGGAQDNGSLRSFVGPSPSPVRGIWNAHGFGDGEQNLIDYKESRYVYACSQYGSCQRSVNGGDVMLSFGSTTSSRRNWFTPVEFDPNEPSIMYYGGNVLNRSTNRAQSWQAISPDLAPTEGRDRVYPFGTITTIGPAKSDPDTIYVGTDDGRLWRTRDLGERWRRIDEGLPNRWVTRVVADPRNEDIVYATFSGFRDGDNDAQVFRSTNGGDSWRAIGRDLPDAPVNDVVVLGRQLVVATDVGVFVTARPNVSNPRWHKVGTGLPLVPVTDMRYVALTDELFVATFGRGMYKIAIE